MKKRRNIIDDLVVEKTKLDDKIMKINNFIRSVEFTHLKDKAKHLLIQQSKHMNEYSLVLRDRIVDITNQESE